MQKFRMTFDKEWKPTIAACMKNEKDAFDRKMDSTVNRAFIQVWFKEKGMLLVPSFDFEMKENEVIITVETGLDNYLTSPEAISKIESGQKKRSILRRFGQIVTPFKPEGVFEKLKGYEALGEGKIKVEKIS